MTVNVSGTDAKDIALYFIDLTSGRATPSIISRTIIQAKSILSSGYTKEEIIKVIDVMVGKKGASIYSLGYISASINSVLNEIKKEDVKEQAKIIKNQIKEMSVPQIEVKADDDSGNRNRNKSERFGIAKRKEILWSDLFD